MSSQKLMEPVLHKNLSKAQSTQIVRKSIYIAAILFCIITHTNHCHYPRLLHCHCRKFIKNNNYTALPYTSPLKLLQGLNYTALVNKPVLMLGSKWRFRNLDIGWIVIYDHNHTATECVFPRRIRLFLV